MRRLLPCRVRTPAPEWYSSLSVDCMLSGRERPSREMSPTHARCGVQVLQCENPHYWNSRKRIPDVGGVGRQGTALTGCEDTELCLHSARGLAALVMSRASGFALHSRPTAQWSYLRTGTTAERACRHQRFDA